VEVRVHVLLLIAHGIDNAGTAGSDPVSKVWETTVIGVFAGRAVQQVGSHCAALDVGQQYPRYVDHNDRTEPRIFASMDCASNPGRKRVTVLSATAIVAQATNARDLKCIVKDEQWTYRKNIKVAVVTSVGTSVETTVEMSVGTKRKEKRSSKTRKPQI
jgi:hypothetical protein